jgi:addiction module RelE/StbE family toxin
MKVRWTAAARQDRLAIRDYIADADRRAAARMDALFGSAAAKLADYPYLGKPGRIPGTRELIPHENYRFVYKVDDGIVRVLALVHTARLWPP